MSSDPKLVDLTAAWANAKNREDDAKREGDELRAKILEAGAKIGYRDGFLEIGSASTLQGVAQIQVVQNGELDVLLATFGRVDYVRDLRPSVAKVRALAELEPRVADFLLTITKQAPRFLRASAS